MESRQKMLELMAQRKLAPGGPSNTGLNSLEISVRGQVGSGTPILTSPGPVQGQSTVPTFTTEAEAKIVEEASGIRQKKTGKKRKALHPSTAPISLSPTDITRWGEGWKEFQPNLHQKGKELGPLVENLALDEWEEEAEKIDLWTRRSSSLTGIISYLKSRCADLQTALDEKNEAYAALERAKKEAKNAEMKSKAEMKTKLDELKTSHSTLKKEKYGLSKKVKSLEAAAATFEQTKTNLENDVARYKQWWADGAEETYQNVLSQVRFFNPNANLQNVHYFYFIKDGKLMRINQETKEEEPVELASYMDTDTTPGQAAATNDVTMGDGTNDVAIDAAGGGAVR
ncbi:uncharacterized protein LOC133288385 [Gastrolobium bilobum]|uniref:uncharacterized protein LOC133288385 n=1 Tax=Gastrolobium bilobum TaxID=150636 RepID=UPI002AAFE0B3|nr:uncharacterized protein LOC133288385 [Gastrolobium bilobum]XP_061342107.1 uncharacterized protein LOC133288385 [Gastrolobium bilobum]XP_061342108.1 uncharacterized protein LOC133288385 [Gastrolobium bilobum]XP_061342109.1 uncharacterized protein LOC133288385 [Gastrolobium bilobum]XP_061342111.1 uncharacterized protein LOC133288385 [Gastrolobium bilobum]XP_061342112.1 uncharacterized protein LOC133288385 [Gastrolobium bilobum]XP_061342113.1 uncharacterized protein LOC133288385 [Gastrolobium